MKVLLAVLLALTITGIVVLSVLPETVEPLTELAFTEPHALPSAVPYVPGDTNRHLFSFSITNREHRAETYHWQARMHLDDDILVQDEGIVRLENDRYATMMTSFMVPGPYARARVEVRLLNRTESIHFWIENREPGP